MKIYEFKKTVSKLKRENKVLKENADNTCRNYNIISKRLDRVSDNYAKAEGERVRLLNIIENKSVLDTPEWKAFGVWMKKEMKKAVKRNLQRRKTNKK